MGLRDYGSLIKRNSYQDCSRRKNLKCRSGSYRKRTFFSGSGKKLKRRYYTYRKGWWQEPLGSQQGVSQPPNCSMVYKVCRLRQVPTFHKFRMLRQCGIPVPRYRTVPSDTYKISLTLSRGASRSELTLADSSISAQENRIWQRKFGILPTNIPPTVPTVDAYLTGIKVTINNFILTRYTVSEHLMHWLKQPFLPRYSRYRSAGTVPGFGNDLILFTEFL